MENTLGQWRTGGPTGCHADTLEASPPGVNNGGVSLRPPPELKGRPSLRPTRLRSRSTPSDWRPQTHLGLSEQLMTTRKSPRRTDTQDPGISPPPLPLLVIGTVVFPPLVLHTEDGIVCVTRWKDSELSTSDSGPPLSPPEAEEAVGGILWSITTQLGR